MRCLKCLYEMLVCEVLVMEVLASSQIVACIRGTHIEVKVDCMEVACIQVSILELPDSGI